MERGDRHPDSIGFSTSGFEALTGGICAIAMTLLVLGLAVPAGERVNLRAGRFPDVIHDAIAFFILHGMGVSHQISTAGF
ncbi:MAG: Endosomal/lysosomal potassium channel [Methanofollis sp.]|nr:Endosomal/lysosomal potassium channel [Methanofollis sp.]